ncbi:uncharacterized protein LOC135498275 isoform X2 [Lineus longissimus]|uniref:uncharacterized protein LOC135498275 isoform X2 n=1 Tax=Lineus longissimus TaxID=88925 RepID=UPI00315C7981
METSCLSDSSMEPEGCDLQFYFMYQDEAFIPVFAGNTATRSNVESVDIAIQTDQVELEKLNHASVEINQLELELDDARAAFRQALSESTQRLSALSKKLGSSIEKARPYYKARMEALEAENDTRSAALRFERAFSMQQAAKEMVFLAEQGYFNKGQPFDTAWQEMLNHGTLKVNEAEVERLESELEHQQTAAVYNDLEQRAKHLQKKLKTSISRSKPYFEQKAKFNQIMEERKHHVSSLEKQVIRAKNGYSDALNALETISDEIHKQRNEKNARTTLGRRGSGVGAETPAPPPDDKSPATKPSRRLSKSTSDFSTQTDENGAGKDQGSPRTPRSLEEILQDISPSAKRRSLKGYAKRDSVRRRTLERGQELDVPQLSREVSPTMSLPLYSDFENEEYMKLPHESPHLVEKSPPTDILNPVSLENKVDELSLDDQDGKMLHDFKRLPNTCTTEPKRFEHSDSNIEKHVPAANIHVQSISIVATNSGQDIQKMPPPAAPVPRRKCESDTGRPALLSPKSSVDEYDASDTESVCSSVNVIDDEQLQYLMNDNAPAPLPDITEEDIEEREKWKTMPAKLSYLEYYMKYKMEETTHSCDQARSDDRSSSEDEALSDEEVMV